MKLPNDLPDHHDAELVLKIYDLRREAVMRESRHLINSQFWPKSADEVVAVIERDHPLNAAFRQVTGYWEMVYGMARHGIVHPEYLVENSGEGLFFFVRVEPYLAQLRAAGSPRALRHSEWVSRETEIGRAMMDEFRARFARTAGTSRA